MTIAIARRIGILVFALLCGGVWFPSAVSAQQPTEQTKQYEPIGNLPPTEQIPAPRLLISAYSFVIVGLFVYVVSVARRLTAVQREVERLEGDVKRAGRA